MIDDELEPSEIEDPPDIRAAVREALDRIAKDDPDGLIQSHAVVEAARDPESVLHDFIWSESDEKAAYERRLQLARVLIARYTLVDRVNEMVNVTINAVGIDGTAERRRGYVPIQRAVADPDLYSQVLDGERKRMVHSRNKLAAFERAHAVVGVLDQAIHLMDEQATEPEGRAD